MKTLLVIGHTFPEPSTTAAGSRILQILDLFLEAGYHVTFASTASLSEKSLLLSELGIQSENIELNSDSFDDFIRNLNPQAVLFDRYISEEQFGWRVADQCPEALRVLDTEDLHFLRKAREEAVLKDNIPVEEANLFSETAKREIASMYRCDLSLLISEAEITLLQDTFKVPKEVLYYVPFLAEGPMEALPSFNERSDFMTIGNLLHAPNVDSVQFLKKEIWPKIRKQLPEASLHIYGNYAPQKISELHNEKEGFLIKGWVENVEEVMKKAKVSLAPLRFGAGLKGKIFDAMRCGTPSVTTTIGSEGMHGSLPFAGCVCNTSEGIAEASVEIYTNEIMWLEAQERGFEIIQKRFQKNDFSGAFLSKIERLQKELLSHRQSNFIGEILQYHSMRSTMYMSKWIETKNR